MKTVYVLRGIATIAVVVGHAIGWIYLGQAWWLSSNPGSPVHQAQIFTPLYHVLFSLIQLSYFSVPAFLFASGFFLSFAAGNGRDIQWKMIRRWISGLIWPLIIWAAIMVISNWLPLALFSKKEVPSLGGTILDAIRLSYFVPLVVEFYLLAPWIMRMARSHPVLLMSIAVAMHLITVGFYYVDQLSNLVPEPIENILANNYFFFWSWAIYFPLGTICGLHFPTLKPWLSKHVPLLAGGAVVLGAVSIVEMEFLGKSSTGLDPQKYSLSVIAYSIVMIMLLLAVTDRWMPFKRQLTDVGAKSLGVYLAQVSVLVTVARAIYHTVPDLMFYPLIFFIILFSAAFGLPLLLGRLLSKHSKHTLYPYLFG